MEDKIREAIMKMGKPEDMPAMVVDVCNDAWRDLMKQKLMTAIDRSSGANMDKTAAVTVAYLNEYWMAAMTGKELPRSRTDEFLKKFAATMQG
jgi:hypothetical protein